MSDKILINDKRLNSSMKRVRSGRDQVFQENGKEDISIRHENKEMYAELIDGLWYWVNGCSECNGEPRDWLTYIECEKHDRCSSCSTNRKEIKGPVWGGKKGWTCKPCKDAKDSEIRREAFENLNGNEPDCSYNNKIICPHCGSEICNDEMYESQDIDCFVCEGEIHLEVEYSFHYSTRIKGKRVTE